MMVPLASPQQQKKKKTKKKNREEKKEQKDKEEDIDVPWSQYRGQLPGIHKQDRKWEPCQCTCWHTCLPTWGSWVRFHIQGELKIHMGYMVSPAQIGYRNMVPGSDGCGLILPTSPNEHQLFYNNMSPHQIPNTPRDVKTQNVYRQKQHSKYSFVGRFF